jgi:uncharacterized protein (DUF983 family)
MPTNRADVLRVLRRGLAKRCPSCGLGHVFSRGLATAVSCGYCGWRFERCPGHWVGGNEINLLVTFPVGVAAFVVAALFLGLGPPAVAVATAATGVFSVAFHRSARGLFFAFDYLVDASPDSSPPDDDAREDRRDGPSAPAPAFPPPVPARETSPA